MRENRTYGSEGGESGTPDFPTPIKKEDLSSGLAADGAGTKTPDTRSGATQEEGVASGLAADGAGGETPDTVPLAGPGNMQDYRRRKISHEQPKTF
jgi:hypothetical protein